MQTDKSINVLLKCASYCPFYMHTGSRGKTGTLRKNRVHAAIIENANTKLCMIKNVCLINQEIVILNCFVIFTKYLKPNRKFEENGPFYPIVWVKRATSAG